MLGTEAEGRTNQLLILDQKHASQVPLTASDVKMSQFDFSVTQKNSQYQWPEGPIFQRERREPVQIIQTLHACLK